MQAMALALFWLLAAALASAVGLVSLVMQLVPGLRSVGEALGSGTIRSLAGAFVLQVISMPLFLAFLIATWAIQDAARVFGASADDAIWFGLPMGVVALAVPPIATLCGAYIGFRAGWLRANGRDPQAVLSGNWIARLLRHLGSANPVGW